MKRDAILAEPKVVILLYDLNVWFMQRTNRYPKNLRATLGDRIDNVLLEMLDLAQRAGARAQKSELLRALSDDLERLRTLARLSCDLRCLEGRQYEYVSRRIDEIGRQIGGWMRYLDKKR